MSDLIDRQVAIDKLQKEINKGIPPFDDVMGAIRCGVRLARNIIEDLPSADPHWIPCSERLPKEKDAGILKKLGTEKRSEYVLATVEVKGERMTVTACTYDGKWDWNMKYAFPDFKVVAWMPFPEPYGKEKQ